MSDILFTIIIPVYNDARDLELVLNALENQSYSKSKYEVIVVDNGSTDDTVKVAEKYKSVILFQETNYLGSPYSCRNRGIEAAKGNYIIFLDATCIPLKEWLKAFEQAFKKSHSDADLIGGKVSFRFADSKPTAAEYYDSITNIRMKEVIEERQVAKTANLAVTRNVINKIGMFDEGIRSGGDVIWTGKAVANGFKLKYCQSAEVFKQAREYGELIKKQWRVSKAQPAIWIENKIQVNYRKLCIHLCIAILRSIIRFFWIALSLSIKKAIRLKSRQTPCKNEILGMAFIPSFIRVMMRFGNIYGYYKLKSST